MPKVLSKSIIEIADAVGGELCGIVSSDFVIDSLAISPKLSTEKDLVLVFDPSFIKVLLEKKVTLRAKVVILPSIFKGKVEPEIPVIWVERPRLVLKKLLDLFNKYKYFAPCGIHQTALVDKSASVHPTSSVGANVFIGPDTKIGENTKINPNVYIGANVIIGNNCTINANCTILDNSIIGSNVILHSGVVIGSDGYSYVTEEESNLEKAKKGDFTFNFGRQIQLKITSIGNVIIEDDVEIGSNTCVDSGTIGSTIIGAGTKIDNLVQVAHNCCIGKDCLIVGQVGFAGSVHMGDRVVIGGQAGFADNIKVGSDVIFGAQCGVHGNIPANSVYFGTPAVPFKDYLKNEKDMRRLPRKYEKLEEQIKGLENKIKELESKMSVKV